MRVRGFLVMAAMVGALLPAAGWAPAAGAATTAACPEDVPRAGFRDVAATNVHAESVDCAVWWEMVRGSSRARYRPGASVTRGQMATFVAKMILRSGGQLAASPGDLFGDDEHSPHHYSINRLAKAGIVSGSGGHYRPDALVTRAQMATFLVAAYEYRTGEALAEGRDAFGDDNGSVHEANINKAAAAGFTSGAGVGGYDPASDVARAQMASFVTNALEGVVATGQVRDTPETLRTSSSLESYDDCEPLLGHLKERGLEEVGPYGWNQFFGVMEDTADGAPAPTSGDSSSGGGESRAGVDYSETNNQEAGVDEADVVKTDGRIVVSVVGDRLRVVDVTGEEPRLVGSLALPAGYDTEVLLRGTKALVMSTDYGWDDMPRPADTISIAPGEPGGTGSSSAVLTMVDLTVPSSPRIESTLHTDGWMVAARMIDGVARLVVRTEAPALDFTYPADHTEQAHRDAAEHNRLVVERSVIEDWLPGYRLEDRRALTPVVTEGALMGCADLRRPPEYSGLGSINVLTVDMGRDLQPGRATGVLAGGDIVYGSPQNLYVATTKWGPWRPEPLVDTATTTEIHKFSITDPATARYEASGKVPGFMLNQFSMSEFEGNLRTATTSRPAWWGGDEESSSQVVVLQQSGGALATIGQVGGLGRGEQIFAVRFIGDQGYVVTFRQTDPLYTIDLSDPAAPRVAGELKILGYSAYLHPVGEGLLLGVGQDADDEGRTRGTQLSLFDVSDPAAPARIAQATLVEGTHSDVEFDHRAFLHWPPTGTTVLPISRYHYDEATQTEEYFVGAAGFDVDATTISHIGEITHGAPPTGELAEDQAWPGIRRSLVIRDVVYTLSERGLKGSNMTTLADESWTPFDR